jgi:hypothetical protein
MPNELVARNGLIALKDSVISGSLTVTGSTLLTGSVLVTGSFTVSGSKTGGANPTIGFDGSVKFGGYARFEPVGLATNNTISASYVYASGSTNDLYFTQNSAGYSNTTRLRWIESNLYTGLLSGGVISASLGSTSFSITSGSAIIVTLNASTASADPYPTVKLVSWNTQTQPLLYSASAKITYIGISNTGQIVQQTVPWGSINIDQFDTEVEIGVVLHLSGSVVTGTYNTPQISYGYAQQTDDFIRAFGPIKISGHTLQASGSAPTLSIIKTGGTAYNKGANYVNNANHPSTVTDPAFNISKIYRYYISGSTPVIDSGVGGAGYTEIDNKNYVNTTTGTLATVGASNWSIQRVFWIPNSPTNAFLVYYGNARYGTLVNAVNAKDSEAFTEAPNTAQNAIFLGYIIIQGGGSGTPPRDLNNSNETAIIPGGLFRSVGGVGSSGTAPVSNTLAGLSDVAISSPSVGDLLVYGTGTQWNNNKALSGSYSLTGSLSFLNGGVTGSLFGTASNAISASYATTASYADNFLVKNTITAQTLVVQIVSSSIEYASGSNIFGTLATNTQRFTGSVLISGSITVSGSVINNLTASFAQTASYIIPLRQAVIITGSLIVSSSNANTASLSLIGTGSGVFTVDGTSGRLFSVDDSLSGSLFSVNTAAGLPVIEAFSDNTVRIGQYGKRVLFVSQSAVGINKETALNGILDISGSATITGSLLLSTGSMFGLPTTSSLTPVTGSMFWSSSLLFIWNGTRYMSASFA